MVLGRTWGIYFYIGEKSSEQQATYYKYYLRTPKGRAKNNEIWQLRHVDCHRQMLSSPLLRSLKSPYPPPPIPLYILAILPIVWSGLSGKAPLWHIYSVNGSVVLPSSSSTRREFSVMSGHQRLMIRYFVLVVSWQWQPRSLGRPL